MVTRRRRARRRVDRRALAATLAATSSSRAGVVCEQSNDPVGVELAGAAKNAAALAAGRDRVAGPERRRRRRRPHLRRGLALRRAAQGARPESMIGLAGTGDLVAHRARAPEPQPPRRRAARRRACRRARSPGDRPGGRGARLGAAAGARADRRAGIEAPVTDRAAPPDRRRAAARRVGRARARDRPAAGALAPARPAPGAWARMRARLREWLGGAPVSAVASERAFDGPANAQRLRQAGTPKAISRSCFSARRTISRSTSGRPLGRVDDLLGGRDHRVDDQRRRTCRGPRCSICRGRGSARGRSPARC